MKRIFPLFAILLLVLALPAHAATPYALKAQPYLSFDGTTARCSVTFTGDDSTDEAYLSLTLYQGNTFVNSWSASGTDRVRISETCRVESGKTYRLVLTWFVNGKTKPSLSTTKTCP